MMFQRFVQNLDKHEVFYQEQLETSFDFLLVLSFFQHFTRNSEFKIRAYYLNI